MALAVFRMRPGATVIAISFVLVAAVQLVFAGDGVTFHCIGCFDVKL